MRLDGVPALPAQVFDTGLLFQPNFEVLQGLSPDLIVITAWHGPLRPKLERIAPTLTVSVFVSGIDAYTSVCEQTRRLGRVLGRESEAEALHGRTGAVMGSLANSLRSTHGARRPVSLILPLDYVPGRGCGDNHFVGRVVERARE